MHASAPDYLEPVSGWRVWLVVERPDSLRLASVLYPKVWPVRSPFGAGCASSADATTRHRAPDAQCGCGIHAAVSVEDAAAYFDGRGGGTLREAYRVIGRVALWGFVVEGDKGFRASRGYPRELYVPARPLGGPSHISAAEVAAGLRDYGVPVTVLDGVTKGRVTAELRSGLRDAA